jgi:hypothetical protein
LRGFRVFFCHPRTVGLKPNKPKEKRAKGAVFPQSFVAANNDNINSGIAVDN